MRRIAYGITAVFLLVHTYGKLTYGPYPDLLGSLTGHAQQEDPAK